VVSSGSSRKFARVRGQKKCQNIKQKTEKSKRQQQPHLRRGTALRAATAGVAIVCCVFEIMSFSVFREFP
jgi:hypothetical protein